jgi:hypothetical protein
LILVGLFGALARAPLPSPLLRYSSSERDDGRDGHKADEHKAMWRRIIDLPRFHLANDRQSFVICSIFVTLGLTFPKSQSLQIEHRGQKKTHHLRQLISRPVSVSHDGVLCI